MRILVGLLLASALAASPGLAQPLQPEAAVPLPPAVSQADDETLLAPEVLQEVSGRENLHMEAISAQELGAHSSGNVVTAGVLTSGSVTFSAQALDGFAGIGNFVVNTGSNNVLQGAISLSVVGAPGP
jgi:hypothetical protein